MPKYGNKSRNGSIKRISLAKLHARDSGICHLCEKYVDLSIVNPDPMSATRDHIIPLIYPDAVRSQRGIKLAHYKCNHERGSDLLPPDHKSMIGLLA